MRVFRDDPTRYTDVQWYFTDPATPTVGYPSSFVPQNWELGEKWVDNPLGEVQPRAYTKGFPPFSIDQGSKPCGTMNQWLNGASINDSIPSFYPGTHVPGCCPIPAQVGRGGIAAGDRLFPIPCGVCRNGPGVLYATFSNVGCTIPPQPFNLVVPLHWGASCTATFPLNFGNVYQSEPVVISGVTWLFVLSCYNLSYAPWALTAWQPDCLAPAYTYLWEMATFPIPDCVTWQMFWFFGLGNCFIQINP